MPPRSEPLTAADIIARVDAIEAADQAERAELRADLWHDLIEHVARWGGDTELRTLAHLALRAEAPAPTSS